MNDRRTVSPLWRRRTHSNDTCSVTTTSLLSSILNWLRAGYPEGVPGPDRVPLLALLRATPLTEDQIKEVVRNITADGSAALADGEIGEDEIAAFIKDVSHHDAGPENVQRVAAKLAAAGWPLAGVGEAVPSSGTVPQRRGVDDEAVPHVAGEHALVGLVDVIRLR